MSASPFDTLKTITASILAKQEELFYDECVTIAQTIADNMEGDTYEDDDEFVDHITEEVNEYVCALNMDEAENLIRSYGITNAIEAYRNKQSDYNSYTITHGMLLSIITEPIIGMIRTAAEEC